MSKASDINVQEVHIIKWHMVSVSPKYKHFIQVNECGMSITSWGFILLNMDTSTGIYRNWKWSTKLIVSFLFHLLEVLLEAWVGILKNKRILHWYWCRRWKNFLSSHIFNKLLVNWPSYCRFSSQWSPIVILWLLFNE